ncbi:hypothetical protein QBC46DRAFT_124417 [Diplogelasinospora grovesii]|uniref:WHIM1 domain-containing protein n=1 Tax=Diplogelasinospora grovesii TaxID=303347 RepID=A0AAN6N787_9PEZI|nr:hypothetical protein QBC46DRAFT_124417 [Diplogelasinospora grovesii]
MADDDSSELSSISSLSEPPSDDESDIQLERHHGILKFFHKVDKNPDPEPKETTPPRPKREPSPPHEYVLADNPDIAFIVMFRSRFMDALPKSLPNFGPQELERDVVETTPGERVVHFLCALLGLLLNRKQDVKPGHYGRALEEAIQTHKGNWPREWENTTPLSNGATFASMTPVQRLTLLRTLVLWTLSSSDVVKTMINTQYKNRHDDDLNVSLSVQPWGSDGDKRRYFLIEGNDDTAFRVYRESNPAGVQRTWWSVAGTIDELKALAEKLEKTDGGPKARALAKKMINSVPRFEATEEKRRRREYRQMRKEQFKRPEPGFSLYEGRTRGKRMKYTYSDDEDEFYTDSTNRRSTRNTRHHTPADNGPVTTASGRQVRASARLNADRPSVEAPSLGSAGDVYNGDSEAMQEDQAPSRTRTGRPARSAAVNHGTNGWATNKKRKSNDYDSEEEDDDEGSEPDLGDDEEDEHVPSYDSDDDEEEFEAEDDEMMDDAEDADDTAAPQTTALIFKFPIRVKFGEDSKVQKVDGPPITYSIERKQQKPQTKHPRAAHAHRNVIISDESEEESAAKSADVSDDDDQDDDIIIQPEDEPAAEEIAVAFNTIKTTKEKTPEPPVQTATTTAVDTSEKASTPARPPQLTPTSGQSNSTSLAFRGSPEKSQHVQPHPIGVGYSE